MRKLEEILSRWGDNVKNTPIYDVLVSVYGDNGAKSLEIKFENKTVFEVDITALPIPDNSALKNHLTVTGALPFAVEVSIEKAWSYITDRKRGELYIYDNDTENTLVVGWDWDYVGGYYEIPTLDEDTYVLNNEGDLYSADDEDEVTEKLYKQFGLDKIFKKYVPNWKF